MEVQIIISQEEAVITEVSFNQNFLPIHLNIENILLGGGNHYRDDRRNNEFRNNNNDRAGSNEDGASGYNRDFGNRGYNNRVSSS